MGQSGPLLLLGGEGMLGSALRAEMKQRGLPFRAPTEVELDLRPAEPLESTIRRLAPTAVINAAAYTDVGAAERPDQRDAVFLLNATLPGRLAAICRRLALPLIHVSTDYVFDGEGRQPYSEQDPVAPLQVYGLSKLEGERAVREVYEEALITRTSTLYGPGQRPRPHYVDAILAQARVKQRLDVVRLPISSPTYAPDLAIGLLELLGAGARGLVHTVNDGHCSRLELARAAVELAGLQERVRIEERPAPADDLARPPFSALDTSRYRESTGRSFRHWKEALRSYVEEYHAAR